MNTNLIIALVAVLAASACALAGVFLVLRRLAMMGDAISHAGFAGPGGRLLDRASRRSGWPARTFRDVSGRDGAGVLTVVLVEALTKSQRVKEDAAIGIVFPALFALGVFVISQNFRNVHLDTDAVLFGEIALAPFDTLILGGRDYGPQALWILGTLTLANALFLALFYKELKLSTFDPGLAAALGFAPALLHYALMTGVAVTTVGALSAVGAILVVALLIVPPVTASLLTRRLPLVIALSLAVGVAGALSGFGLALLWNVSISGMIAAMLGALFGATLLLAPEQGLVAQAVRRRRQRHQFATEMLVVHLATHENTEAEARESAVAHLEKELNWEPQTVQRILARAGDAGLIARQNGSLQLTPRGRDLAQQVATR
jgi:manganese/zinc/iron transport system permease protein